MTRQQSRLNSLAISVHPGDLISLQMVNPNANSSCGCCDSPQHNPSFVQPFDKLHNSINLRIPPPFIGNFNGNIPDRVSLQNTSGLVWPARLGSLDDNDLHITVGWNRFAKQNGLETGDLLVFHYLPASATFLVMAFGPDDCSKLAPLVKEKPAASNPKTYDVRKMQFYRIIKDPKRNFVTVPKALIKECVVNLPEKVELSFEGGRAVTRTLMGTTDRLVLGYKGMYRFWEKNKVEKGDKLEFQIIRRGDNTIEMITIKKMV